MRIEFIECEHKAGVEEYAITYFDDDSYTVIPKAVWDEQQAQKELGGTL